MSAAEIKRRFDNALRRTLQLVGTQSQPEELDLSRVYLTHDVTGGGAAVADLTYGKHTLDHIADINYVGFRTGTKDIVSGANVVTDSDDWWTLNHLVFNYQAGAAPCELRITFRNVNIGASSAITVAFTAVNVGDVCSLWNRPEIELPGGVTTYKFLPWRGLRIPPHWDGYAVVTAGGAGANTSIFGVWGVTSPFGAALPVL